MKNRDIYLKDPSVQKLVNEGVANVNDDRTSEAMAVLRYELETFVCDGQYEKGLELILETYLKNIDQAQQPAVWISGFYGSGKSHLVKMLRTLWADTQFEDGATAHGISSLPENIQDLFKELNTQGKRYGGLHAASGTLGAGASGSVRLALLRIIFKSVGLPEQYSAEALKKKLELILEGEAPCDIFVRWNPIEKQPIGWNPDLNDGVRLNIRPFMTVGDVKKKGAGVLRDKPNIKWGKDRGKDVASAPWYHLGPEYGGREGDRINDHHLTLAEKRNAREKLQKDV